MRKGLALLIAVLLAFCAGCGNGAVTRPEGGAGYDIMGGYQDPENDGDTAPSGESGGTFVNDSDESRDGDGERGMEPGGEEGRVVTCYMCHGDGICYHCDGDAYRNGRRCSVCDGTGKCSACEGNGEFEAFEIDGKDYTICGSCHGEGICGVCSGTGRIVQQFSTLGRIDSECHLCHGSGDCLGCKGTGLKELKGF